MRAMRAGGWWAEEGWAARVEATWERWEGESHLGMTRPWGRWGEERRAARSSEAWGGGHGVDADQHLSRGAGGGRGREGGGGAVGGGTVEGVGGGEGGEGGEDVLTGGRLLRGGDGVLEVEAHGVDGEGGDLGEHARVGGRHVQHGATGTVDGDGGGGGGRGGGEEAGQREGGGKGQKGEGMRGEMVTKTMWPAVAAARPTQAGRDRNHSSGGMEGGEAQPITHCGSSVTHLLVNRD